jgi:hypothetical protein
MRNAYKLLGIAALALAIVFSFASCNTGGGGGGTETMTYKGKGATSGDIYTLTIKKTAARAFVPIKGDEFELTDGPNKSKGTVDSFDGSNYTLQPSYEGAPTFGATVSGNDLIDLSGIITLINGMKVSIEERLKPVTPGGGGSSGVTWTAVADTTFGTENIQSVVYGGDKFVAGGMYGKMAYSSDGINWTAVSTNIFIIIPHPSNALIDNITGIVYGNSTFTAVGGSIIAKSSDGINWIKTVDGLLSGFSVFAWCNNGLVSGSYYVGAGGGIGINGISSYPFGTGNVYAIAYGNGKYVVGGANGKMAYSE